MDLLLICRDALASSLIDNMLVAIEAKRTGTDVSVLFTQEAVAAVAGGTFGWPAGLSGQNRRYTMADAGSGQELLIMGSGQARQLDSRQVFQRALEAGVPVFASGAWVELLGLHEDLPTGVSVVDSQHMLDMLRSAKCVVGTL